MAPTAHRPKTTKQWPGRAMLASLRLRNIHESSVLAITALTKPTASTDAPPSYNTCRRLGSSQVGSRLRLVFLVTLLLISEIPMCAFREKEKSTAFLAAHVGVWFWFLLFIGSTIFTSKKFRIVVTPLPTIFTSLPANYGGVVTLAIC
jgi:hypothetical protein